MARFPSVKARAMLGILMRTPLNYRVVRRSGSHRLLASHERPAVTFAFHDKATLPPRAVRAILIDTVGLSEDEALELL
jgi:predicted RNA binding protein YcfA (HicA-like mRNA interferase family)